MAFIPESFKSGRGIVYANSPIGTVAMHTYKSATDTTYDILANGYFPANYGLKSDEATDADYLWISGTNDIALVRMQNVSTVPILYTRLSYYNLSGTFNLTFQGPWVANITVTCPYTLQGSVASFIIPIVSGNAPNNDLIQTTGAAVPANLLPIQFYDQLTSVLNPGQEEGLLTVNNISGAIQVKPFANYSNTADDYGFLSVNISYYTNTTPP